MISYYIGTGIKVSYIKAKSGHPQGFELGVKIGGNYYDLNNHPTSHTSIENYIYSIGRFKLTIL